MLALTTTACCSLISSSASSTGCRRWFAPASGPDHPAVQVLVIRRCVEERTLLRGRHRHPRMAYRCARAQSSADGSGARRRSAAGADVGRRRARPRRVAVQLGIPEGTAKSRLRLALGRVRSVAAEELLADR